MIDLFINQIEVKEYLEACRLFCDYIESTVDEDSNKFLTQVRLLLLTLYQKGLVFPLYNGDSDEDAEDLLGETYFKILKQIEKKVGKKDFYNHIYNPTDLEDNKPVSGLLSDDLGDIYRDIKRSLLQIETESELAKAYGLWSLHFLFRSHYAEHIINALYATHFYLQDD